MNQYVDVKERAISHAKFFLQMFETEFNGKPLDEVEFNACLRLSAKLDIINGIFGPKIGEDIDVEAVMDDPLLSITIPLAKSVEQLIDQICE